MVGYHLFRHAVLMLIDNIVVALRMSVLPFLALYALTVLMFAGISETDDFSARTGIGLLIVVLVIAYVGVFVWIAVGWHRYVLLEAKPSPAWPKWSGQSVSSYIWACFRLVPLTLLLGFL
ncbi:hypothetical protein [Tropicibacter sp. Alg240-R139]|uniref:hypothetical protein n=1 Tax=Tropicibacter sp. Alg240-R139 TaxID=2305991 RepID=UPI0019674E57|nr:hypothetical protein [Tropicibacter sp. Alg240-R139]